MASSICHTAAQAQAVSLLKGAEMYLVKMVCFFIIGFVLSKNGIHPNNKNWWFIMLSACVIGVAG